MKALTECKYGEGLPVRVFGTKIEPWFVAIDVFKVLGIHTKNMTRALARLDDDEKMVVNLTIKSSQGSEVKSKKGNDLVVNLTTKSTRKDYEMGRPDVWLISEPGLYKIMLSARTEKAKAFTRWVTHDVLPSIRKYGYYKMPRFEERCMLYDSIMKDRGVEVLGNEYTKMSLDSLRIEADIAKHERELREEREEAIQKYPYTADEMDGLCQNDLAFVVDANGLYKNSKYMVVLRTGEELYNEKFKSEIPKFLKNCFIPSH